MDILGGLQQRVFNTLADAWYVVVALAVLRRTRPGARAGPESATRAARRRP